MAEVLLFDLDGTLVDTAPTLAGIVNTMLSEQGLPLLPLAQARNLVSRGAAPLITRGFQGSHEAPSSDTSLQQRFFELYESGTHSESRVFVDLNGVIHSKSGFSAYGIVTNKPTRLTRHLLGRLALPVAPACVVCGDTLPTKKPDPAPLLHAAELLGVHPAECIYVGDDHRDVVAGRAAGMQTVVAAWGYIPPGTLVGQWGADAIASHPTRLHATLAALEKITDTQRDER